MNIATSNSQTVTPLPCKRVETGDAQKAASKERCALVAAHLPMVSRIAKRVLRRTHGQADLEELVAWGTTGLLEAIDRFIPGGEATLATFAYYRVRGAMLDGIGKIAPLSRKDYRHAASVGDFHAIYSAEMEPEHVIDPRKGLSPEDFAARKELHDALALAIRNLPTQQQTLVVDHYFGDTTLQASGKAMGISKSWASRAHANALANLRQQMESSLATAA
ncbi:MAG: sigma-70 family RNA polymerase sigma factor [Myxococcales bacterium]|nr:sigma-70 family RNA polymerase sigma factor [Myxococcales bacterium]